MPMPHRDTAQPGHAPGLIESLYREWPEWCEEPGAREAFAKWRSDRPVLAGFESLSDLIEAMPSMDAPTIDAVFSALLSYATDPEHPAARIAARVVLQLMLPKVVRLAGSLGHVREIADREAFAVTGMYEAIRTYPLVRWPWMTPLCLARWGRWLIHRSASHLHDVRLNEFSVDPDEEAWLHDLPAESPQSELLHFLVWAVQRQVISVREANELLACASHGGIKARARERGIRPDSLREYLLKARRKLSAATELYNPETSVLLRKFR